jgi:hypothetical protein
VGPFFLAVTAAKVCPAAITDYKNRQFVILRAASAPNFRFCKQGLPVVDVSKPVIEDERKLAQDLLGRYQHRF